ncbi:LuxR C-terminal-related transcriptional regulator [Actinoplanes sp. Pm04-4]|uniref:LuxR C-terminal-related transcriptional regulator n=1 Tax=Paractinoplanes pyxinae TaxID=2997416 RepID=A0ABT4AU55_9ACTN|nr:LuxR C-terminal-related transcriptional regulator [Actinoplanes pyxinae]MCY1136858.1 LuxR C-terminal-related transcriptional regulator [Actinoplanes pyxinae]
MSIEPSADSAGSLLNSKFAVPAPPPFMVDRPALADRLTEGVQGPLTLVTGLAGSGKTQLLASWARSGAVRWPIVWIAVEPGDERGATFWTYLIEGLRRVGVRVPAQVPAAPGAAAGRPFLARVAAALAACPTPVVLVLDGASQLAGRDWAAGLEFLQSHASGLRLVLSGRWDPPLPLYRYRLAGELSEIRTADLAFRADEAARLLELHGVTPTGDQVAELLDRTEGWAAGIRLYASARQGCADPAVWPGLTGNESSVAEYFIGEVLRFQPPVMRRFLLETSVLDTFTAEFAAAVTGRADAGRLLAGLTRENAFIQPVGDGTGLYRYHHLFADLLRAQLAWAEPDQVALLHGRAADWLFAHGRLADAVAQCARAGDWETAATMVIEDFAVGQLVIEGSAGRLGGVLAGLPQHQTVPETVLVRAALTYGDGDHLRAAEQFAYASKLLAVHGSACGDGLTLAFHLMQLLTLPVGPEPEQVEELAPVVKAFLAVTPERLRTRHPELRMLVHAAEGVARGAYSAGDETVDALAEAVATAPPGAELVKIDCLGRLAVTEAYRGWLGRAETYARQALDLAAECGLSRDRWPAAAEVALAWVALERYDIDAADRHLRAAQPLCATGSDGPAALACAVVKARRLQIRGETRQVMSVLVAAGENGDEPPRWLSREIALSRIRLLITAGRTAEAAELLAGLPATGTADVAVTRAALLMAQGESGPAQDIATAVTRACGVPRPVVLEAWLLLAMLAEGADDAAAREALRRALTVAAPESYRRPVHQVWNELRRLLRDEERSAVQQRVLSGAAGPAVAEPIVVEALSRRELDVLRGMAEMLPTEEIAASMYVSVNTVKTHVRNILRKLSASRRNEAVRRARSLKLI